MAFGVANLALAAVPGYAAGLILLVPIGAAAVLFISSTNSLLQLNAADSMRGRVMALWSVVFLGSTPIGGPLTGALARGFGVRWAVAFGGVAAMTTAFGAFVALRRRKIREGAAEAPVCLPDGPSAGDALAEAIEVGGPHEHDPEAAAGPRAGAG
jgi:MFS family permease